MSIIIRGKKHICNSSNHIENIKEHITTKLDPKEKDHLLSKLIKHKVTENSAKINKNVSLSLSQTNGKPLNVIVHPKNNVKDKNNIQISSDDFLQIQNRYTFSFNVMRGLSSSLRSATKNRNILEPNINQNLLDKNHLVDDFFKRKTFDFVYIKGENLKTM